MLKHLCHAHIAFDAPKDDYKDGFLIGTVCNIKLEKSKLSPKFVDIPCYIDVTKGGKIDPIDSFVRYIAGNNVNIITTGSWYKFSDKVKKILIERYPHLSDNQEFNSLIGKNYRKDDMYEMIEKDPDLFNLLQVTLIDFLNSIYPAQSDINEEYKQKCMSESKYFRDVQDPESVITVDSSDEESKENSADV